MNIKDIEGLLNEWIKTLDDSIVCTSKKELIQYCLLGIPSIIHGQYTTDKLPGNSTFLSYLNTNRVFIEKDNVTQEEYELLQLVQQYQKGIFQPCPFCGFAYPELNIRCDVDRNLCYQYVCKECGMLGPLKEDFFDAYRGWNTRKVI